MFYCRIVPKTLFCEHSSPVVTKAVTLFVPVFIFACALFVPKTRSVCRSFTTWAAVLFELITINLSPLLSCTHCVHCLYKSPKTNIFSVFSHTCTNEFCINLIQKNLNVSFLNWIRHIKFYERRMWIVLFMHIFYTC